MSTYLFLILQMLADMGVPMMGEMQRHLDQGESDQVSDRVGPARDGVVLARSAHEPEWKKVPKEFENTVGISNGF